MEDPEATAPIKVSELRDVLAREGHAPVPDDETPTEPDLLNCKRCKGAGKTVVETEAGGYRGPVRCPECKGTGRIEVGS